MFFLKDPDNAFPLPIIPENIPTISATWSGFSKRQQRAIALIPQKVMEMNAGSKLPGQ